MTCPAHRSDIRSIIRVLAVSMKFKIKLHQSFLTIIQKTGALIWACQGRLTTSKELPDGDSQLPVRTQLSRRAFDHKRNIIMTLLDSTLFIVIWCQW
jgi:hypothetical protein